MSKISRRKLITTGLWAAAGASGLGVAAKLAERYGLIPPDSGGIYGAGDCTGGLPLASVAAMQGRIAIWHAMGEAVAAPLQAPRLAPQPPRRRGGEPPRSGGQSERRPEPRWFLARWRRGLRSRARGSACASWPKMAGRGKRRLRRKDRKPVGIWAARQIMGINGMRDRLEAKKVRLGGR